MKEERLFLLSEVSFGYDLKKPTLYVPHLEIQSNQLIFVVGVSGIGKSTFLEGLGLMNDTILSGGCWYSNGTITDLNAIWKSEDKVISKFREDNYSFIFQDTNLMPNFSVGENMGMGMMMNGQSMIEVKPKLLEWMEKADLPLSIFDRHISEISGGQRQRLAFIRGVCQNFEVLFGDEPTGNLDKITTFKVISLLKELLVKSNKTGIIVSHDLELALSLGDVILPILPSEPALLSQENQWTRNNNDWYTKNEKVVDPITKITQILSHI